LGAWYEEAFRSDYLRVYPHRDGAAAAAEVAAWLGRLPGLDPGRRVLDLACGAGRHLRALRAAGVRAAGCDLSADLLAEAARDGEKCIIRCDIRSLPFRSGAFDAATMFFNSFGYFDSEEEDAAVLREAARVLVPSGGLLLDLPWPREVRRGLVPRSSREAGGVRVDEERELADGGRRVRKRVTLRRGDEVRTWTESVRLYSEPEVRGMAAGAGLALRECARSVVEGSGERPRIARMVLCFRKEAA
jgi:SAM-dependent methyltransferase